MRPSEARTVPVVAFSLDNPHTIACPIRYRETPDGWMECREHPFLVVGAYDVELRAYALETPPAALELTMAHEQDGRSLLRRGDDADLDLYAPQAEGHDDSESRAVEPGNALAGSSATVGRGQVPSRRGSHPTRGTGRLARSGSAVSEGARPAALTIGAGGQNH